MTKERLQKIAGLLKEAEDFDLSDNPLRVNPNSWKTFKKACERELAHLMPLTSECSLIEPGSYGAYDKLIGSFLNGYEMLDFYIEACQEWYDGDFQEMLDSWGSYVDIEETAEDLAKATVYVSGIDDDIILAIVEDVYYMVNYDEEALNEAEDFDLSDNPLVGNYKFKIGEKSRVFFAKNNLATIKERIDNGTQLRDENEGKNYPILGVDIDLKDEIMANPWYLVKFQKPYKIRKDKYTYFIWLPQYCLSKVVVKEEEDFDLSDNPLAGEPATELLYTKFGGMENWIDVYDNSQDNLVFGNRYNKHVFNSWDEWVNWLADEATDLQREILSGFSVTPIFPITNSQFERAKTYFNMYQKKNNGAPFILMSRK